MVAGWLVPTHKTIVQDEKEAEPVCTRTQGERLHRRGLLGEENKETFLRITEPGPQFLLFLESQMVQAVKKSPKAAKKSKEKYEV